MLFWSSLAHAQTLLERIVDSALINERHEFFLSKLDSAFVFDDNKQEFVRPFESADCVIHEIYNCNKNGSNFIRFDETSINLIDTNLFTKKYFISGRFLEDWVALKEQGKAKIDYLVPRDVFVFDTVRSKAYYLDFRTTHHEIQNPLGLNNNDATIQYGYIVSRGFQEEEKDFIGALFKTKAIDFVFQYPTFIHHDGSPTVAYISWELGYCFAMKGNRFFYIDLGNKMIYPMEEVVENHWGWITNVIEKQ